MIAAGGVSTYNASVMKASAALVVLATALLATSAGLAATPAAPVRGATYTVAFSNGSLPANVDKLVADAGGTIIVRLPQIGGIGVVSSNPGFAAKMSASASVAAAQKSARTSLPPSSTSSTRSIFSKRSRRGGGTVGTDPQPMPDSLGSEQWDKMRMNATLTGSYAVNQGRPEVHVALTDTGIDQTHPDISSNLDVADSRSFLVAPDPSDPTYTLPDDYTSIQDFNGHGTWTASAVAAPINGIGLSGVAPKVSIVSLKTQDATGSGLLLYFDQALVYAGDKHFDVVSSSIDGYAQKCPNGDDDNKQVCDDADYVLARRAVKYARERGVLTIAAMGNDNLDLADAKTLASDAVFGVPGVVEVPGGLPGVVGVSATGYFNQKAYYSNYGQGIVDVAAPGGDPHFQLPPDTLYGAGGELLGAWSSTAFGGPRLTFEECFGGQCGLYAGLHGTSMSTPNAAGVAALIVSKYGDFSSRSGGNGNNNSQNGNSGNNDNNSRGGDDSRGQGHMSPAQVEAILLGTASNQACPDPPKVFYDVPLGLFPFPFATCQGGRSNNGFYGAGIVNALSALTLRRG